MTDRITYRVRWVHYDLPRADVCPTLPAAVARAGELAADPDVSGVEVVVETVVYRAGDGENE